MRAAKGYQILKLETSKPAAARPFDSVRDLVADTVYQERSRTEMRKFIERVGARRSSSGRTRSFARPTNSRSQREHGQTRATEVDLPHQRRRGFIRSMSASRLVAIWTRSRHEQVVREQLEKKGFEAFLPTITRWSRWKDRKKKIDWPLFPGYCFARFDADERLPILKCTGVVSIVSFDGEIAPIPEQEIDGIRRWSRAICSTTRAR